MLKLLLSVILFPIALAVLIRMICATWKGLVYLLTCWQFWTVIGVILMIVALSYQVHAVVNSVKRDGDYQYLRALQVNWPLIERARTWLNILGMALLLLTAQQVITRLWWLALINSYPQVAILLH
jgi:hypothetical protein